MAIYVKITFLTSVTPFDLGIFFHLITFVEIVKSSHVTKFHDNTLQRWWVETFFVKNVFWPYLTSDDLWPHVGHVTYLSWPIATLDQVWWKSAVKHGRYGRSKCWKKDFRISEKRPYRNKPLAIASQMELDPGQGRSFGRDLWCRTWQ